MNNLYQHQENDIYSDYNRERRLLIKELKRRVEVLS